MKLAIVLFSVFASFIAEAKAAQSVLQKTLEKYSKATSIQFDIKKIDEKIILGTKSESQGVLKYKKNKIYIMQNGDKKVEIFYVDGALTLVEHPDIDFDPEGKRKVTKIKNTNSPLIKSLLNLFSDSRSFNKQFSTVSEKIIDDVFIVELKPKAQNIKNLILKINTKNLNLIELSFEDDVQTKTTLEFDHPKLNAKIRKDEFQYKMLKTDEVMAE